MSTAFVNEGIVRPGQLLMPQARTADLVNDLIDAAPNHFAASYLVPQFKERVTVCADAVWCAQQVASGRNRSEEIGRAIASYARKFSQESYMSSDSLIALTAITTLGVFSVRRTVLDNGMGDEVAGCLKSAVAVGRLAQRHAAAEVLSRYALHAVDDFCDAGMLLGAASALTDVVSALRAHRSKLGNSYELLMLRTLRSLASVGCYVGRNEVSAGAARSLREVFKLDEAGPVRTGAFEVAAIMAADARPMPCGSVKPFGPIPSILKNTK